MNKLKDLSTTVLFKRMLIAISKGSINCVFFNHSYSYMFSNGLEIFASEMCSNRMMIILMKKARKKTSKVEEKVVSHYNKSN